MSRAGRPNTNRYRQIDPSVTRDIGQPTGAVIATATDVVGEPNQVQMIFAQPVTLRAGGSGLGWAIADNTFNAIISVSADARNVIVAFSDPVSVGDTITTPADVSTREHFVTFSGGVTPATSLEIISWANAGTISINSITAADASHVDISFDAAIALTSLGAEGPLSNLTIASATIVDAFDQFLDDSTIRFTTTSAVEDGLPWSYTPPGLNYFVSITGQRVATGEGFTLAP